MPLSVKPHTLVLTYARCDYCKKNDHKVCCIGHMFGIKTCDEHYELAKRDCNSYLHSNHMVRLKDVQSFLDVLPETFAIKRSSGIIEDGWKLNNGFIRKIEGEWCFPCINEEINITKNSLIKDMTRIIDEGFINILLMKLEEGIYVNDYNMSNELEEYEEHPCVKMALVEGVECRVFIPSHPDSA